MGVSLAHSYGVVNTYQSCLGGVCLINTGILVRSWTYVWLEMEVHRMSDRYKGNHCWLLYGIKQSNSSGLDSEFQSFLSFLSSHAYPPFVGCESSHFIFSESWLLTSDTRDLKHYFVSCGGFRTIKYAVCGRNELLSLISTKILPLWIRGGGL